MELKTYICNWIFYIIIIRSMLRYTFRRIYSISKRNKNSNYLKIATFESTGYDFSMRIFTICTISFGILYFITNKYNNSIIIQSGILVPVWLFITGILIRVIYHFAKLSHYGKNNKVLTEDEMQIYWITIPIMVNIVYFSYNFSLALMITAIIIGKFLWLDTIINPKKIKLTIMEYFKRNKQSIYVLIGFAMLIILGIYVCKSSF